MQNDQTYWHWMTNEILMRFLAFVTCHSWSEVFFSKKKRNSPCHVSLTNRNLICSGVPIKKNCSMRLVREFLTVVDFSSLLAHDSAMDLLFLFVRFHSWFFKHWRNTAVIWNVKQKTAQFYVNEMCWSSMYSNNLIKHSSWTIEIKIRYDSFINTGTITSF